LLIILLFLQAILAVFTGKAHFLKERTMVCGCRQQLTVWLSALATG